MNNSLTFTELLSSVSLKVLMPIMVLVIIGLVIKLLIDLSKVSKKALLVSEKSNVTLDKVDALTAVADNTRGILDNIYAEQVDMFNEQLSAIGSLLGIKVLENIDNNILGSALSFFRK